YYYKEKVIKPHDPFRFLIVGDKARKGIDLAVRAFKENFVGLDAELIIRGHDGAGHARQITNINTKLTQPELRDLYHRADCVLAPSRGEGWGMPALEAMACGTPTIIADNTGLSEFAKFGISIKSERVRCNEYFIYGDAGYWYEPDYDELVKRMVEAYQRREVYNTRAGKISKGIAINYSWEKTANKLIGLFGADMAKKPDFDTHQVIHPKIHKYTVKMKKDWLGVRICGVEHNFHKCISYPVAEDIKSIMENQEMI
ncbi:hypothetical protein LCGC14_2740690, partial [marine sediment metagenome]